MSMWLSIDTVSNYLGSCYTTRNIYRAVHGHWAVRAYGTQSQTQTGLSAQLITVDVAYQSINVAINQYSRTRSHGHLVHQPHPPTSTILFG